MSEEGLKKTGKSSGVMEKRGGYQPLNEGYTPLINRGYRPTATQASATSPKAPTGGSGQSSGGEGKDSGAGKK